MRYHKAHLTRRLILDISADSEIEENMVEWLRVSRRLGVQCSLFCMAAVLFEMFMGFKMSYSFVYRKLVCLQTM